MFCELQQGCCWIDRTLSSLNADVGKASGNDQRVDPVNFEC